MVFGWVLLDFSGADCYKRGFLMMRGRMKYSIFISLRYNEENGDVGK
jgi:hypothetical protein